MSEKFYDCEADMEWAKACRKRDLKILWKFYPDAIKIEPGNVVQDKQGMDYFFLLSLEKGFDKRRRNQSWGLSYRR